MAGLELSLPLPDVQAFALVHLVSKLGTAANDAATSLKLLEKGLSKEDLALAVLLDFPFQILFGWLAARWSAGEKPLKPVSTVHNLDMRHSEQTLSQWLGAMWFRLLFAVTAMLLISNFPSSAAGLGSAGDSTTKATNGRHLPLYYFLLVIASTILASFASTVQFVGISAFHTIIADPAIGGTYMTVCDVVEDGRCQANSSSSY